MRDNGIEPRALSSLVEIPSQLLVSVFPAMVDDSKFVKRRFKQIVGDIAFSACVVARSDIFHNESFRFATT